MATREFTINLQDTIFPFLTGEKPRTVINSVPGEIPQPAAITYCHNVMPTKAGFQSISYEEVIPEISSNTPFAGIRLIYGGARARIYLGFTTQRDVYALLPGASSWIVIDDPTATIKTGSPWDPNSISVGTVNGISYIFFNGLGTATANIYTYDEAIDVLTLVSTTGITVSSLVCISSSSGYLVAFTAGDIAWSSTIDPTDFVPSEITGAGGGSIADLAGAIVFVTSNSLGMLVFTEANVVAAIYTGNVDFPWKFRAIFNSKGGISLDLLAYEANTADQFVYSKAGMQLINSQRAEGILPEVTDFLAGGIIEGLNEDTFDYTEGGATLGGELTKQINFISSRYLVISFGFSGGEKFDYAFVYDTILQKLGRLKISHEAVFEYVSDQNNVERKSIAFLSDNGVIQVVEFGHWDTEGAGIIVLGKLQHSRNKFITLLGVEIESKGNSGSTDNISVHDQATLDGVTFKNPISTLFVVDEFGNHIVDESGNELIVSFAIPGVLTVDTDTRLNREVNTYKFRVSAKNHSIIIKGYFNLSTVLIQYKVDENEW